ncbi:MAG TPA: hypothetical protein VHS07_00870 [Candidatus Binataceae bacterium]|nr:hypothetical protein [Candidatus Binataceae bacterium]
MRNSANMVDGVSRKPGSRFDSIYVRGELSTFKVAPPPEQRERQSQQEV